MSAPTRLTRACLVLGEVFDKPLTQITLAAYAQALEDIPVEALEEAARHIVKADQFFPRPYRWREVALDILKAQREAGRMERVQGHALPQDAGTPEELAAKAKAVIGDLAAKMGWRRPGSRVSGMESS